MQKKSKNMFHALHKVDVDACYAKQKINLACPKRKVVNRMLLHYSWQLFIKYFIKVVAVGHSKWKVFQKLAFHWTSTIYLLLWCSTEKQTQLYKYFKNSCYFSYFLFKFPFFWFLCFHLFCVLYFVLQQKQPLEVFCKKRYS